MPVPRPENQNSGPADPEAFTRKLAAAGFHLETPRSFESNVLYDTPEPPHAHPH